MLAFSQVGKCKSYGRGTEIECQGERYSPQTEEIRNDSHLGEPLDEKDSNEVSELTAYFKARRESCSAKRKSLRPAVSISVMAK